MLICVCHWSSIHVVHYDFYLGGGVTVIRSIGFMWEGDNTDSFSSCLYKTRNSFSVSSRVYVSSVSPVTLGFVISLRVNIVCHACGYRLITSYAKLHASYTPSIVREMREASLVIPHISNGSVCTTGCILASILQVFLLPPVSYGNGCFLHRGRMVCFPETTICMMSRLMSLNSGIWTRN